MRCGLYFRWVITLLAPVLGACEAVLARRTGKGPTGFVRDRAVAQAQAEAKETVSMSARVLSPSRLREIFVRPTQSVRLLRFRPPLGTDPLAGVRASACARRNGLGLLIGRPLPFPVRFSSPKRRVGTRPPRRFRASAEPSATECEN